MIAGDRQQSLCVGIVTRDRRETVLETIRQVVAQLRAGDELVVVDNLSRDGTCEAVTALLARLHAGGRVVVEPRGGVSAARNRVFVETDASVVCFLDDDVWLAPTWLPALRTAWGELPQAAAIGGPIRPRFPGPRPDWLVDRWLPLIGGLYLGDARRRLDQSVGQGYLWGANISVRRSLALAAGGFDVRRGTRPEALYDDGEEEDLQRRLAVRGLEIWYEPGASVCHLVSDEHLRPSHLRRKLRGRGRSRAARGAARRTGLRVLAGAGAHAAAAVVQGRRDALVDASLDASYGWALAVSSRRRPA